MPRIVTPQSDHSLVGRLRRAQGRSVVDTSAIVPGEDAWLTLARNNPNANIVTAPYDPVFAQTALTPPGAAAFMWLASSYLSRSTPITRIVAPSDGSLAWTVLGFNGAVLYSFDTANNQLVLLDRSIGAEASRIKNNNTIPFATGGTHGRGLYFYGIVVGTGGAGITAGHFYGANAVNVIPDNVMNSSLSGVGLVPSRFPLYAPAGGIDFPPTTIPFGSLQASGALGAGAPWFGVYSA